MVGNGRMNHFDTLKFIYSGQGCVTANQVRDKGTPSWHLSEFVKRKGFVKIAKGFYASSDWPVDDFLVFQYEQPRFVNPFPPRPISTV